VWAATARFACRGRFAIFVFGFSIEPAKLKLKKTTALKPCRACQCEKKIPPEGEGRKALRRDFRLIGGNWVAIAKSRLRRFVPQADACGSNRLYWR
jgi:hypothetical protein